MRLLLRIVAGFLGAFLASGAGGACAEEFGAGASPRLEVAVHDGLLTVRAESVPVVDVLEAVGEAAGLEVAVRGEAGSRISALVVDQPIHEALRRLLRGRSAAIVAERSGEDGTGRLRSVRVHLLDAVADGELSAADGLGGGAARESEASTAGPAVRDVRSPGVSPYDPLEERRDFARVAARGAQPDAVGVEDLTTLLLDDADPSVRGLAASALGRLGGAEAGDALALALSDRNRAVRRRAARALGNAWGHQAIESLAELLVVERSRSVRRVAAHTVGLIGGETASEALEPLLDDPDPHVRRIARQALGGS